jgi:orotate phosphoribosyltransferase
MSKNGSSFNQNAFNQYIIEHNVVGFKETKLNSGRISPYYVNWKFLMGEAYTLNELVNRYVIPFVKSKNLNPKSFIGVIEGSGNLGATVTYEWAKQQSDYEKISYPIVIRRSKPKDDHGDPKYRDYVFGDPTKDSIIIEDTTTTATSVMKEVSMAKEKGVNILGCVALTDRNEIRDDGSTVQELFEKEGVPYYPMSNAVNLVPLQLGFTQRMRDKDLTDSIKEYFGKFGATKEARKIDLEKYLR